MIWMLKFVIVRGLECKMRSLREEDWVWTFLWLRFLFMSGTVDLSAGDWDGTVSLMGYLGMKAFDRIATTSLDLFYLGYGLVLLHRPARVCRSPTGALPCCGRRCTSVISKLKALREDESGK